MPAKVRFGVANDNSLLFGKILQSTGKNLKQIFSALFPISKGRVFSMYFAVIDSAFPG